MLRLEHSKPIKAISIIVLAFFLWSFGGVFDIACAITDSSKLQVSSSKLKEQESSEKFEETIEKIREAEERTHKKIEKGEDTETEEKELKSQKTELEKHDIEIKKQFKDTEEKIKSLPEEIKQRHRDFVKKYEENLNILKTNLDDIEKAKTKEQKHLAHKKTKEFLEKVKPPKKHKLLDPNKLPHRTAEPIFKEPRTSPEQFKEIHDAKSDARYTIQDARFRIKDKDKNHHASGIMNQGTVLVASNGPLDGLLDSDYEPSATSLLVAQATNISTDADLAETIEVQFTPEIRAKAEELGNNPVKIYEYVRNNFEYEPYYGSLKGAQQTLLEKAGNDFDQASLLISLLRAANIPARYVYGTVEMPIEDIKSWLAIDDTNMALTALSSSGIPLTALTSGGTVVSVQLEHVWCQAFVPYVQSRGASEGVGDTWVDIDPSFKSTYKEVAENIELPSFNQSTYLARVKQNDPIVAYESDIQAYLDTIFSDRTTGAVKIQKEIEALWFEYLLGTLSYDIIASTTFTAIPDTYRYKIAFSAVDEETELFGTPLTYTVTTPEIAGKRVSLSYSPATDADTALINQYGGLYNVPAYLLQLKPELRIDGEIKASGSAIGFGKDQYFRMNFRMPYGKSDTVENIVIAGGYYVPVINLQDVPEHQVLMRTDNFKKLDEILQSGGQVALDDYAGEILNLIGLAYFQKLNATTKNAEQILKVVDVKGISEAIISIDVSVDYAFGIPIKVSLSSLGIDVDRYIHLPIPIDGNTNKKKEFMILSGMTSSFFEHKIFEDIFAAESVSAIKIIQIANERGIPIYTINSGNISTYINNLQISSDVKTDVINAVNTGKEVIIPQQEMQINDWFGTGYIVTNLQTGAAAYKISGGIAGGSLSVMSLSILGHITSYQLNPKSHSSAINNILMLNYVNFPGPDDLWYSNDDKTYPLVDLIRLPEEERVYYYDPHFDRGDSGVIKIDDTNKNDNLTSFLNLANFQSHDYKPYLRVHHSLIFALQLIKWYANADLVGINSGYRTTSWNASPQVNGEPDSWHMDGLAADVRITINGESSLQNIEVYNKLKEAALLLGNQGGVGCYPVKRFIHVDTRGIPKKWGRCR